MKKKNTYHLCTFFDKNYLYKGLALYKSLEDTSNNFKLWILCNDKLTYETLGRLKLKNAGLLKIGNIENKDLLIAKSNRSNAEYCLTLKPAIIDYVLKNNKHINKILYLDSDIGFFQDVELVFNAAKKSSIGISPHNFPQKFKGREKRGGHI